MKKIIFVLSVLISFSSVAKVAKVFSTKEQKYISYNQFMNELPKDGYVVLGEYHNDQAIQEAQAKIIQDKVVQESAQRNFKVMWEFLNFTDQEKINIQYQLFVNDVTDGQTFVSQTAGKQNLSYTPIFEVSKKLEGNVVGLNLPRSVKKQVMENGIGSVEDGLIPPNHRLGSDNYYERFKMAMGGHAPDSVLQKYFLAQSLTDSVMSYHAHQNHDGLSFIVAGSFHTDFYDGTVLMLKELDQAPLSLLKIINANSSQEEIEQYQAKDPKYGYYADYIILAGE